MGFGFAGVGALLSGGSVADATTKASGGNAAVWGTKPKVADFAPVDLMAEQKKAIDANVANSGGLDKLLNSILPGYTSMRDQASHNTLSLLHGELPDDVKDQVQRNSAYQSLIGGYAGTGMSKALSARDLGRTSLDMIGLGDNTAQLWSRIAAGNSQPYEISTGQQALMAQENNRGTQNTEQLRFNVNAAPDPAAAGKFGIDSAIGMKLLSVGTSAAGGAAGSDVRLKTDIQTVGFSPSGIREVEFAYRKDPTRRYHGAIAQEVREITPEAVSEDENGYLRVHYDLIDVPFREIA